MKRTTKVVRIGREALRKLKALARREKEPIAKTLRAQVDRAIFEKYEREIGAENE